MNGHIKWHKGNGPAFDVGQVWVMSSRKDFDESKGFHIKVVSCVCVGIGKHDYIVTAQPYMNGLPYGQAFAKDVWNFQVSYIHIADINIK